jgi:predicted CXXCH cytochrome family protein
MNVRANKIWILFVFGMLTTAATATVGAFAAEEKVLHHGELIDAANSKLCLTCHDGVIGPHVKYCTRKCDFTKGHVVFWNYPPRGKEREFVPITVAESRGVVIDKGQVTCISCHNVRNPAGKHLVMENKKSELCLSCHIH